MYIVISSFKIEIEMQKRLYEVKCECSQITSKGHIDPLH